jgi:spore coat polysaccharide biosynthesis protein SpsF (cytidylyltransferase family)
MALTVVPLAILQARIASTRLARKMLLPLGDHPLIWWAWRAAVEAFSPFNAVIAMPASQENDELAQVCAEFGARVFRWDGPEDDVLGRFYHCAHRYRRHPDTVIVRVTPDDPFKVPDAMRRVAAGERLPVELGGEAFTLEMLDEAHYRETPVGGTAIRCPEREHLTRALFRTAPPPPPDDGQVWTVDSPEDYARAQARVAATKGEPGRWSGSGKPYR